MTTDATPDSLRYPIGSPDRNPAPADLVAHLEAIRAFPGQFAAAYAGLNDEQLDTPYRDEGWTLRQLAHHVADSHTNAWIRLKLALTEEWPTIVPYDEKRWAQTAECAGPVDAPLAQLSALHIRMHALLSSLGDADLSRGYVHPQNGRTTLAQVVALYSWHGRHHTAHVTGLRSRKGW
jgi:uncharacterized damage-inducible protein DinB